MSNIGISKKVGIISLYNSNSSSFSTQAGNQTLGNVTVEGFNGVVFNAAGEYELKYTNASGSIPTYTYGGWKNGVEDTNIKDIKKSK